MSGGPPYCIDPDPFLDLSASQPITAEAGRAAWASAYVLLAQRLAELGEAGASGEGATLYLVFGLQGADRRTSRMTRCERRGVGALRRPRQPAPGGGSCWVGRRCAPTPL